VGTSSLRRESQLRARFPQLKIEPLRGNVQTRLRKLDEGQYAAIILAAAGLKRLGLGERIRALISSDDSLPAVGQGALGIECRAGRADVIAALQPLHHAPTAACVFAERAMSRRLAGSCQVPLGGFAEVQEGGRLRMRGFVATPDGQRMLRAEFTGDIADPEALGNKVANALLAQGAGEILAALNG
jgi:hydroxymethylbilane synthase